MKPNEERHKNGQVGSEEQLAVENNIYQLESSSQSKMNATPLPRSMPTKRLPMPPMHAKRRLFKKRQSWVKFRLAGRSRSSRICDAEWALQQDYYEKKLAAAIIAAKN